MPHGKMPAYNSRWQRNADAFFYLHHRRADRWRIETLPGIIGKDPWSGDQIRKGVVKLSYGGTYEEKNLWKIN